MSNSYVNGMLRRILAKGWKVSVNDGEEFTVRRSTTFREIVNALETTDSDLLVIRDASNNRLGCILLIWGNDDNETVADHTDNEAINSVV